MRSLVFVCLFVSCGQSARTFGGGASSSGGATGGSTTQSSGGAGGGRVGAAGAISSSSGGAGGAIDVRDAGPETCLSANAMGFSFDVATGCPWSPGCYPNCSTSAGHYTGCIADVPSPAVCVSDCSECPGADAATGLVTDAGNAVPACPIGFIDNGRCNNISAGGFLPGVVGDRAFKRCDLCVASRSDQLGIACVDVATDTLCTRGCGSECVVP